MKVKVHFQFSFCPFYLSSISLAFNDYAQRMIEENIAVQIFWSTQINENITKKKSIFTLIKQMF